MLAQGTAVGDQGYGLLRRKQGHNARLGDEPLFLSPRTYHNGHTKPSLSQGSQQSLTVAPGTF